MRSAARLLLPLLAGPVLAGQIPLPPPAPAELPLPPPAQPTLPAEPPQASPTAGAPASEVQASGAQASPPSAPPAEETATRIVGGKPVQAGEAPWQVSISASRPYTAKAIELDRRLPSGDPNKLFLADKAEWERNHACGGAFIAPDWVITAAHCFVERLFDDKRRPVGETLQPARFFVVRTGSIALPETTTLRIERVVIHGDYRTLGTKRHDIALVRVTKIPGRTDEARLAAVAPVRLMGPGRRPLAPEKDELEATGWGVNAGNESKVGRDFNGNPLRLDPILQKVPLKLKAASFCAPVGNFAATLGPGVLCAVGASDGQDTCQGDSGGPVTRDGVLVGLVSFGYGCGVKGRPALYTEVAPYAPWIQAVMAQSQPGASQRCVLGPTARLICTLRPRA